ncbi:ORF1010 [White spot syndrome virus]|uniref:ORF1010 n=1 Tax=White spot syndrome virus TaxID=342409 RepID=A0A2D3I520_9VIRU|nr:ORF1010 [White spot syndrome virus]
MDSVIRQLTIIPDKVAHHAHVPSPVNGRGYCHIIIPVTEFNECIKELKVLYSNFVIADNIIICLVLSSHVSTLLNKLGQFFTQFCKNGDIFEHRNNVVDVDTHRSKDVEIHISIRRVNVAVVAELVCDLIKPSHNLTNLLREFPQRKSFTLHNIYNIIPSLHFNFCNILKCFLGVDRL